MDQEQSWITTQTVGDDDNTAATNYSYFMRPEPRDNLGPIETIDDPYLGRTKVRKLRVGMVRNAKDEDKKEVTAYLEPYPHTRIDDAKPLQGWYKSLHEPKGTRPRPCFTEAILTEPYGGWCAVGCAFSLPAGELIDTPFGPRPIESFLSGDVVWGRSPAGRVIAPVEAVTSHWKDEGYVILTTSDGRELRMTADHPVYSSDRGTWVPAEELNHGERLETFYEADELQVLLRPDGTVSGDLRPMSVSSRTEEEGAERPVDAGATQGDGQKGVWSEVCGVSFGESGRRQERGVRISVLQAWSIYGPQGQDVQDAIRVGTGDGTLVGREGVQLGLRAGIAQLTERQSLHSRFQTRERLVHRGQGSLPRRRSAANRGSTGDGVSDISVGGRRIVRARHPVTVVQVQRVGGRIRVFDIQTTTGDMYQRGILVHQCYVNSGFRGYRGTGLITVPLRYGEQIAKQLTKVRRAAAGYFSSFTDPFTPLEAYYHNTEEAAREFVKVGLPIFFLSRLRYPTWAIDLMTVNPHSYAQKSINTSDPEDWRRLSPGAMSYSAHLKDITRIKKRGVYVSIQCNPIVPGVTSHDDVFRLFRDLAKAGADHVIVKFVEAGYSWAPAMTERMIKRFGPRGEAFAALFTENIGGQRTIAEAYRMEAHERYSKWAKGFGLTYATCYEYEYAKDANGRIIDKTGVSVGRKYTTADQCHGHAVPVYRRDDDHSPFQPVEDCPPTGCLYCASENGGEARCGDTLAGEANALRAADLKVPIGQGQARNENNPRLIQLGRIARDS